MVKIMMFSRFFVAFLISLCFLNAWSQSSVIEIKNQIINFSSIKMENLTTSKVLERKVILKLLWSLAETPLDCGVPIRAVY